MKRQFPSQAAQQQVFRLRNQICRLSTPQEMAAVSSHLRNYVVAETVAVIGSLDSHARLSISGSGSFSPRTLNAILGLNDEITTFRCRVSSRVDLRRFLGMSITSR